MYHKTVLKNGVRIISERLEHLRSVSLGIWVNAGSRDEVLSETGVSHFIEHMSFKCTRNRTGLQIAKELDAIGGLSNAFTGKENTCFHGRVLGKHLPLLADILSDILLNPTFDSIDMERERDVIFQEINMTEDSPDDNLHLLFNRLFWPDHPIGRSILGTEETVTAIDKETILKYIEKFYAPERILVVAAGNVDHEEMVSYLGPLFEMRTSMGQLSHGRSVPTSNAGVSLNYKALEQVHLCLGGEAPSQVDERRFACAIFNTIFGASMSSRLFQEVREKRGLAYAIYSFSSSYEDAGHLGVYAATELRHLNPLLRTIKSEIRQLCKGELNESDLAAAKEHLTGSIYLSSESADSRMMRMAKNEFVFGRYVDYDELVSKLERVTVDEIVEVANDIFRRGKISFAALGPLREKDLERDSLEYDF